MNTCKTCKHWKTPEDSDSRGFGYQIYADAMCRPLDQDTYEPMARGFEVRLCGHPSQTFCEAPVERDGFGLADGSEYMAVLATAEDFGCVRHEK